jgi:hypothetical protein
MCSVPHGQRQAHDKHVGGGDQFVQIRRSPDPIRRLVAGPTTIDGVNRHAQPTQQPGARDANPSETQNARNTASQHPIRGELIEIAAFQVVVLDDQPLGRRQRHGHPVLGHWFGIPSAVEGDPQRSGQSTERDKVDAGADELQQRRVAQ